MFAYIKGTLIQSTPTSIVVEANGIGYKLFVPANVFSHLPQTGALVTFHTSFVVREQAQSLYGFLSIQERDFFEALLSVTGIGPKIGLALIGHMPAQELQQAILNGDTATLCRVPGIGKKGAERLIIEMRDKVGGLSIQGTELPVHFAANSSLQIANDAMSALINLGYNQSVAQKAIKKSLKDIPEGIDLGALISLALKNV